MGLSSVASIALQGLREQAINLESTAGNIAHGEAGEYTAQGDLLPASQPDEGVDLATEMLSLTEGEAAYRANAAAFDTGADLWTILGVVTRD